MIALASLLDSSFFFFNPDGPTITIRKGKENSYFQEMVNQKRIKG